MPDWNKLKEEKHENILLGRCENQALELMKGTYDNFESDKTQEHYKKLVGILYKLNLQVEAELLSPKKKEPSENQKQCPKCKALIPKTWKFHSCGWRG